MRGTEILFHGRSLKAFFHRGRLRLIILRGTKIATTFPGPFPLAREKALGTRLPKSFSFIITPKKKLQVHPFFYIGVFPREGKCGWFK